MEILNKYTKDKETKKRQAAVAAAEAVEAEKEGLLRLEQAKAAKLAEQAERFKVRAPEDLVLALLDGAIQDEGKVSDLIVEAQKIEAQVREKPGETSGLAEKMRAKKSEARPMRRQGPAPRRREPSDERVRSKLAVELQKRRGLASRKSGAGGDPRTRVRSESVPRSRVTQIDKPPGSRP